MNLLVLNAEAVRQLLPMGACIGLMREAMSLVATGEALQPIRQALRHPGGQGLLSLMPGHIARPDRLGVKVVTVFPGNFGTAFGSHQGMVLLFETEHGAPLALLDAREITAIRTAAATAVATDCLARAGARTLGVFGYGEQAATHLEALTPLRDFSRVLVWGRDPARAMAFAAAQSERLGLDIRAASAETAGGCDVVVTATASTDPVFFHEWLHPGQHLNVVGSSIPTTAEIDGETMAAARVFVDYKASALALAGDFARAKAQGLVDDDHLLGSIGEILVGAIPGRRSDLEITLFKSLGMVAEDLVAADFVFGEAQRQGVGQQVEW
jgi:ornithine cyclodeaminase